MKKKIDYRLLLIVVLILIFSILAYAYFKPEQAVDMVTTSQEERNQTVTEANAEIKTITNTISSSGEVKSALEETITLHTGYYFSEIYFEENEAIVEGEKIIKYTNGTYLTAPYACVITQVQLPETGGKCSSQHSITMQSVDSLIMTMQIEEEQLANVSVGQEAQIQVKVLEDKIYSGYITKVSSSATYSGGNASFSVAVEFPNDGLMKIGMSAICSILLEKAEDVVVVPIEAVQTQNGKSYVTVVQENGTSKQIQVITGIQNDAYIEIISGLEGNETVQITENTSSSNRSSNRSQKWIQAGDFPRGT